MGALAALLYALLLALPAPAASLTKSAPLRLANGHVLPATLRLPARSRPRSLPAVLLFGGFETSAHAIDLLGPDIPLLLATFPYPLAPPEELSLWRTFRLLPATKSAIHDTLDGIPALVARVKACPEVDPHKILLVGASFGAPFVSIAAPDDPDVSGLILAQGFGDIEGTLAYRLTELWEPEYGLWGKWAAQLFAKALWLYADVPAPEERLRALRPDQKVLLLTAAREGLLPARSVEVVREALRHSPARWAERTVPGPHLRPDETTILRRLLEESLRWMREVGLAGK